MISETTERKITDHNPKQMTYEMALEMCFDDVWDGI
jgi:hypothetical protein